MLMILSPAKKQRIDAGRLSEVRATTPQFSSQIETLMAILKEKSAADLQKLMALSPALAKLNVERFQTFDIASSCPALFAFQGDVYQGLSAASLSEKALAFAEGHLAILSGLYGLLRPFDWIKLHRLEMGSSMPTPYGKNLYQFWGESITDALNKQLASHQNAILINLASQEYFKAIRTNQLQYPVIHMAGRGSDAYHPSTLIALLIYGYATGVYSSRKIERASYDSIAFRYIAGNVHPDHATLAGFRKSYLKEFEAIFVQVLQVAKEMKLLTLGKVSLDGSKIKANASKHKALSYGHINKIEAQLREEVAMLLKRAEQIDNQAADEMDLPAELERREQRLEELAEELAAAKARIEERARIRDAEEQAEYEAKCAKREALRKEGIKKPKGKDPEPPTAGPRDKDQVNLTDEESRIMKASGGGFVQGYNAQAAVDLDTMLIVSAKVTQDCNDKKQIEPVLAEIKDLPEDLGEVTELLADTGYFSEKNVNHCDHLGVTPMIAMKRDHHNMPLAERFAEDAPCPEATDSVSQMAWRLKTKAGRALYSLRKSTVEPVFGIVNTNPTFERDSLPAQTRPRCAAELASVNLVQTLDWYKNVMGFRQFSMRGLNEANGEWNLVAIAWNLKRMNVLKMV